MQLVGYFLGSIVMQFFCVYTWHYLGKREFKFNKSNVYFSIILLAIFSTLFTFLLPKFLKMILIGIVMIAWCITLLSRA